MKSRAVFVLGVLLCYALLASFGPHQAFAQKGMKGMIERGRTLVEFGGCNDCHSPKVFGPNGPMVDTTKLLSGAPSTNQVPSVPEAYPWPGEMGSVDDPGPYNLGWSLGCKFCP